MTSLDELIMQGGEALGISSIAPTPELRVWGTLGDSLFHLLEQKNGFYAFESALHIFPTRWSDDELTVEKWNEEKRWKNEYEGIAEGYLFFAEDVFGNQFCLNDSYIGFFDAETGKVEKKAEQLEQWAKLILDDYRVQTGFPIAHEWQMQHGPLAQGMRLVPKVPFVTGGEYTLKNLYTIDATKGMRMRGNLARQIKQLPDGTKVIFKIVE